MTIKESLNKQKLYHTCNAIYHRCVAGMDITNNHLVEILGYNSDLVSKAKIALLDLQILYYDEELAELIPNDITNAQLDLRLLGYIKEL